MYIYSYHLLQEEIFFQLQQIVQIDQILTEMLPLIKRAHKWLNRSDRSQAVFSTAKLRKTLISAGHLTFGFSLA